MNEEEEKKDEEKKKVPCNKCCFKCANLTELGDGTYICALRSSKQALFVIENPYAEVDCPYYEELPDEVLQQFIGEEEEVKLGDENVKLDVSDDELEDIKDIEDLFKD